MAAATNAMISTERVLDRLDGVRRTRRGWSARCPVHRDRSPSLSIAEGDGGRLLLHCFAGCAYDEIVTALDLDRPRRFDIETSSIVDLALARARRQPWARAEVRRLYQHADAVRRCRRLGGPFARIAEAWEDDPDLYWIAVPR